MNIIVAGITRSGLTLTMQMLNAGGCKCVGEYPGFEKYQIGCIPWSELSNCAVKLVDSHLQMPPKGNYKVIRLSRNMKQQVKSFNKFSSAFGLPPISEKKLIKSFRKDYKLIDKWVKKQDDFMFLEFEDLINKKSEQAVKLRDFLGIEMDISAMTSCVADRDTDCYQGFLELELIENSKG